MFRLKVFQSDGQAYEDLFVSIIQKAKPQFKPIKPQGSIGDRKNDGYDKKAGVYYQVYAPEDIRKTQRDALKKLQKDFKGLKAYWDGIYPVRGFYFVINDKYQGVFPEVEKELAQIKTKHSLTECDVLLANDLEDILFGLADDVIISIVGHIPNLDYGDFLFLSGFTYFMGAWIDFEKTCRQKFESESEKRRPLVGRWAIEFLAQRRLLPTKELEELEELRKKRNALVHGDAYDIPPKSKIDSLVNITEKLKGIS
jgi:hypothetical protein